ncbi:MAG: hypothetical protein HGB23_08695 [Chlorobiaceae bacterium]|nr:hypothetical protein [Chlorobiaceae bacterium]
MELLQNTVILLSGFLLSEIVVSGGAHQRVIDYFLRYSGNNLKTLLSTVLLLSYTLSLFIPHTIVVISMIPVVNRIVSIVQGADEKRSVASLLYLALTWGSNTGGMATLTGSPQNLLAVALAEILKLENRNLVTFVSWLVAGLPVTLILLLLERSIIFFTAKSCRAPQLFESESERPFTLPRKPMLLITCNFILVSTLSGLQFFLKPGAALFGLNGIDLCFLLYGVLFLLVAFILPVQKRTANGMRMNLIFLVLHLIGSPLIFFSRLSREFESRMGLSLKNIYDTLERLFTELFNRIWCNCFNEAAPNLELPNGNARLSVNIIMRDLPCFGITLVLLLGVVLYGVLMLWNIQDGYHLHSLKSALLDAVDTLENSYARLFLLVIIIIFASELLSNTSLILMLAPLSTGLAMQTALSPIMMLLAITIAASSACMTPLATMAGTIAFGSIEHVSLKRILFPGFIMNILAAIVVTVVFSLLSLVIS